jgi:hypothetical protein
VVANGVEYEVDCIVISATGLRGRHRLHPPLPATRSCRQAAARALAEHWGEGLRTPARHARARLPQPLPHGRDGIQAGFTANYPHLLAEQAVQIGYTLAETKARQAGRFELTGEAEQAWVDTIIEKAMLRQKFLEECTPGYYNNEGKPGTGAVRMRPMAQGRIRTSPF